MQATPPGYETAWAERTSPTVFVSRNGSSVVSEVESVTVRRELVGDLPDEVSFVGGSAAATADLAVDSPSSALHPQTGAASVLGKAVVVRAGFGGLAGTVPVFTGTAREWGFNEADRTQVLTARDGSNLLRAPVTITAFGTRGLPGLVRNAQRYPTNTSAVVVAALHACGIRYTPAPLPGCVVSLPLVGGALADVGSSVPVGPGTTGGSWLVAGKFGSAPAIPGSIVRGIPSTAAVWTSGARVYVEWWHYYDAAAAVESTPITVSLGPGGGALQVRVGAWSGATARKVWVNTRASGAAAWEGRTSPTSSPSLTTGWHRLAVQLNYDGVCTCWVDATSWTTSWAWSTQPVESAQMQVDVVTEGLVQAVQLCRLSSGTQTPSSTSFVSAADVDTGALDVDVLPTIDGREAWALLTEVALAELGSVGFDEAGRFAFRNRAAINATTTPGETIDGELAANISGSVTLDGIRTRVTTTARQPWFVDSGRGAEVTEPARVLTLDTALTLPPGLTTVTLTAARAFMPASGHVAVITLPGGAYEVDAGTVLCTDAAGATRYTGGACAVALSVLSPTTAVVTFRNQSASTLYPVWPAAWVSSDIWGMAAGDPALWVLGYLLAEETATQVARIDVASAAVATWGDRVLELAASDWRTDVATVTALATAVLADVDGPRVLFDPITVPADPRRQLGDVVNVTTTAGTIPARLVSLTTQLSLTLEGRMTQTLGLRALPAA